MRWAQLDLALTAIHTNTVGDAKSPKGHDNEKRSVSLDFSRMLCICSAALFPWFDHAERLCFVRHVRCFTTYLKNIEDPKVRQNMLHYTTLSISQPMYICEYDLLYSAMVLGE